MIYYLFYLIFYSGTSPDYFSISNGNTAQTSVGVLKGAGNCDNAGIQLTAAMSVQVDTSNDATNYFCGGHFGVMSGAMTSGVVRCKLQLCCEKGMRHHI